MDKALWSALLVLASTLTAWGMAYSLAKMEVEERQGKPMLLLGLVGSDASDGETVTFDLLARNNSNKEVSLATKEITVYGKLMHNGRVLETCSGLAPVITLQPGETCWLTISFERGGSQYGYFGVSLENVVQFQSVDPAGQGGYVSAYVHLGGGILPISEFE